MASLSDPATFATVRANLIRKGHNASEVDKALRKRVATEQAPEAVRTGLVEPGAAFETLGGLGTPGILQTAGQFQALDREAKREPKGEKEQMFKRASEAAKDALITFRGGEVETGPLTTRLQKIAEKFPGAEATQGIKFRSQLATARTMVRNALLGGAISTQEAVSLEDALPNATDQENIVEQKLEEFINQFGGEFGVEVPEGGEREDVEVTKRDLGERGFLEKLFGAEGISQFAQEAPGIAARGLAMAPQSVADILRGDVGAAVQRGEEFRPEVERFKEIDEAAREEIVAKIEVATGIGMLKSFIGRQLAKRGIKKTATEVADEILKPAIDEIKRGGKVRDQAIKIAQDKGEKNIGNSIFNVIKEWGDNAARGATKTEKRQIAELVGDSLRRFKGKLLNPTTAKKAWDAANRGFKESGKAKETIKAGWHNATRSGVRVELDRVTNGAFEIGTKIQSEAFKLEKLLKPIAAAEGRGVIKAGLRSPGLEFLKKTGRGVAAGVATGIGLGAVAKATGFKFPGAAE